MYGSPLTLILPRKKTSDEFLPTALQLQNTTRVCYMKHGGPITLPVLSTRTYAILTFGGAITVLSGKVLIVSGVNLLLTRKLTASLIQQYGRKLTKAIKKYHAILGPDGGDKMVATRARGVITLNEAAPVTILEDLIAPRVTRYVGINHGVDDLRVVCKDKI
ncbi:hypothetical protein EYC80_002820 [Monilinia laxa]|uniref:Uncharacterized protein n=1 Tax=Monilinia laxa TaxID=61186 RepID=A0A5N6KCY9_MONLA|nr:hypothetical protein EYC80_002820 [Monilinia laxa]